MKRTSDLAKLYAVVTQGFVTIIVLVGLGYFIGYKVNKENLTLAGSLAVAGGIIGIISFITMLFKLQKEFNDEKNKEDKDGRDS